MYPASKNILLISYTFPPYPGIGGRRWAKIAKYLTQLGYIVHVIHAKNPFNETSLWLNDVENNENIIRYSIPSRYPKILLTQPRSFMERLNYKLSLFVINLFSKGTPYDRGIFWKKNMMKLSKKLIKKYDVENVIISCAPFSNAYHAIELKNIFKNLNLMVDMRDPWTWGKGYGMSTLKTDRLNFEKEMESQVVHKFDRIFVPSEEMKDYLTLTYPQFSNKLSLLPHAFDKDEITKKPKQFSDKLRLLFYGSLYANLDKVFNDLAVFIYNSNDKISLDIYATSEAYKETFNSRKLIGKSVNYHSQIPPKDLFSKMDVFDYVVIIQPDYAKDFITTKIYEIIYSGTPILLISNKGKLFDFIEKNSLGLCFIPENLPNNLVDVFNFDSNHFKTSDFSINNYSFNTIVLNLCKFLK